MTTVAADEARAERLRRFDSLAIRLAVLSLPTILLPSLSLFLDSQFPQASDRPLVGSWTTALLLWGAFPISIVGACIAFLAPGVLLAASSRRSRRFDRILLLATCASVLLWATATHIVIGTGMEPGTLGVQVANLFVGLVCFGLGRVRVRRANVDLEWLVSNETRSQFVAAMVGVLCLAALFAPRLLWEDLSGDGAHAIETTRLLLNRGSPFWDRAFGAMAQWPGLNTFIFVYPAAWFMNLIGPLDVSVRLSFLLYLTPLAAGLSALASVRTTRGATSVEVALIWLAIALYSITVCYSASYGTYAADIVLPGAQDTLFVVSLFAYLVGFLEDDVPLLTLGLLLTLTGLPSGIQLVAMWVVIAAVVLRTTARRAVLATLGGLLVIAVLQFVIPQLLLRFGLPLPGREHSVQSIVKYFGVLQYTDVRRVLFVIIPGGVLPAFTMFAWSRRDRVAMALTLLVVFYFVSFYIQAATVLHYYIPAMLIPVAIHWRGLGARASAGWRWATLAGCLAALAISWPTSILPVTDTRRTSFSLLIRERGYLEFDPQYFVKNRLLNELFRDLPASVKGETREGGALAFQRHARRGQAVDASTNYVLQPSSLAPPATFALLATDGASSLYSRSDSIRRIDGARRPVESSIAAVYRIPRSEAQRARLATDGRYIRISERLEKLFGIRKPARAPKHRRQP